jgi:hypothetical protein
MTTYIKTTLDIDNLPKDGEWQIAEALTTLGKIIKGVGYYIDYLKDEDTEKALYIIIVNDDFGRKLYENLREEINRRVSEDISSKNLSINFQVSDEDFRRVAWLSTDVTFISKPPFADYRKARPSIKDTKSLEIELDSRMRKEVVVVDKESAVSGVKIPKKSKLDRSRNITDDGWVLSLVRKADGSHPEHAFLVLEGRQKMESIIWFIDFVGNPILSGIKAGKVRVHKLVSHVTDDSMIYRCDREMMDIRASDRVLSQSWGISSESAQLLLSNIETSKENPPKFNILGHKSVFAGSTGVTSKKEVGHNCFTWAKMQIRSINDSGISLPEQSIKSWVYSATSHFLEDPTFSPFWYQHPAAIATIAGVAAVAGGFVGANLDTMSSMCTIQ